MSFLLGIPLLDYVAFAVDDLNMSAFKFFAVRNVRLAHTDLGQCVLDQQHAVLNLCICGRNIAVLINCERSICCDSIAFRRHCLTQRICNACLKAFCDMSLLRGIPFLDYCLCAVLIFLNDLDMGACELFAVCDINLAYLHRSLGIFDQQHSVVRNRSCGSNIAILINRKCRIGSNKISVRGNCLVQCVCNAGLKTFHLVGFRAGCPLFHDFAILKDLDRRAFDFFAVRDIDLAHPD